MGDSEEGTAGLGSHAWELDAFLSSVPPTFLKSSPRFIGSDHCLHWPSCPPAQAPTRWGFGPSGHASAPPPAASGLRAVLAARNAGLLI